MKSEEMKNKNIEPDVFRDTWVRYLGYANEVGEAFRIQVHVNLVRLSYVVAFGYVAADTAHKTQIVYKAEGRRMNTRVAFACVDSLVWQSLASVVIPGFTINRICWAAGLALARFNRFPALSSAPSPIGRWLITGIGLGSIPFIVKPIDSAVHVAMDNSLRKFFHANSRPDDKHE